VICTLRNILVRRTLFFAYENRFGTHLLS